MRIRPTKLPPPRTSSRIGSKAARKQGSEKAGSRERQDSNQKVLGSMKQLNQFHDGRFQGILIDEKRSHLFLATEAKERFVMVAEGTEALAVDGIKAGNIILDVSTRGHEEILPADIDALHEFPPTSVGQQYREVAIAKAHRENLSLLEINPS